MDKVSINTQLLGLSENETDENSYTVEFIGKDVYYKKGKDEESELVPLHPNELDKETKYVFESLDKIQTSTIRYRNIFTLVILLLATAIILNLVFINYYTSR